MQQIVRCVEPFKEMKRLKVGRVAFIIVMKSSRFYVYGTNVMSYFSAMFIRPDWEVLLVDN